ncbi:MAG: YdjY domain-containing protein [Planctomycetota bacterium]
MIDRIVSLVVVILMLLRCSDLAAQDSSGKKESPSATPKPIPDDQTEPSKKPLPALPEKLQTLLKDATPLNPDGTVFLDLRNRQVILRTEVACPDCVLEMLLVPEQNREHETILRIRSKAYVIHTALLALGLEPGTTATFAPKFVAPTGPEIQIEATWLDESQQLRQRPAQEWIRRSIHRYYSAPLSGPPPGLQLPYKQLRWDKFNNEILWFGPMSPEDRDDLLSKWDQKEYQEVIRSFFEQGQSRPMTATFVFAGSSMYEDEMTGEEYYQAEGGHLICTSNFSDALLDVREESSASDGSQTYEGWTERIPPKGTPVLLYLKPSEPAKSKKESEHAPGTPTKKP